MRYDRDSLVVKLECQSPKNMPRVIGPSNDFGEDSESEQSEEAEEEEKKKDKKKRKKDPVDRNLIFDNIRDVVLQEVALSS